MRLQHIVEHTDHRDHLLRFLREECAPWLAASQNGYWTVWRGVSRDSSELDQVFVDEQAFVKPVRTDRRPMDNAEFLHRMFNEAIRRAGGKANRSNSAFVSGSYSMADRYASHLHADKPMVFVPVGPFHYTWHEDWNDWFIASRRAELADWFDLKQVDQHIRQQFAGQIHNEAVLDQAYINCLNDEKRLNANLIYRTPDRSWIKHINTELTPSLNWVNYDPIVVKLNTDQNLESAISSGRELMIQCSEGLYLDPSIYNSIKDQL